MHKTNKTKIFQLRITEKELNKIRTVASLYADGNVSKWIRFAALNCDRKFLEKKKARG